MATIPKNIIGHMTAMTIHEVLRFSWDVKLSLNLRMTFDVNKSLKLYGVALFVAHPP